MSRPSDRDAWRSERLSRVQALAAEAVLEALSDDPSMTYSGFQDEEPRAGSAMSSPMPSTAAVGSSHPLESTSLRAEAYPFVPSGVVSSPAEDVIGDGGAPISWRELYIPVWQSMDLPPVSWHQPYILPAAATDIQARTIAEDHILNYTPWPLPGVYLRAHRAFCRVFYHLVLPHFISQAEFNERVQIYLRDNSLWAAGLSESVASMAAQLQAQSDGRSSTGVEDPSAARRLAMMQAEIRHLSRQIERLSIRLELVEEALRFSGSRQ